MAGGNTTHRRGAFYRRRRGDYEAIHERFPSLRYNNDDDRYHYHYVNGIEYDSKHDFNDKRDYNVCEALKLPNNANESYRKNTKKRFRAQQTSPCALLKGAVMCSV